VPVTWHEHTQYKCNATLNVKICFYLLLVSHEARGPLAGIGTDCILKKEQSTKVVYNKINENLQLHLPESLVDISFDTDSTEHSVFVL
jgi:hypothetical protein